MKITFQTVHMVFKSCSKCSHGLYPVFGPGHSKKQIFCHLKNKIEPLTEYLGHFSYKRVNFLSLLQSLLLVCGTVLDLASSMNSCPVILTEKYSLNHNHNILHVAKSCDINIFKKRR